MKNFTPLEDEMRYVENLMISESGNIILWGTTNHSYGNVFVAAINMEGEIIWSSYFFETQLWWADLYEKPSGNFLLPMSHVYAKLPEISPTGDSINCTFRHESESDFGSVIQMPSDNYLLTELVESFDPWSIGVDSTAFIIINDEGSILDYHPTDLSVTYELFSIDENEFYAIATTDTAYGSKLIKFDWDFNIRSVINTSKYEASMPWIVIIQGDKFLHAGWTFLGDEMQAVMSMHNEETGFVFDTLYSLNYFWSITHDPVNEQIFALGNKKDSCYIMCLDYDGKVLNKWLIDDSLYGTSVKYYNDQIYITAVYDYISQNAHSSIFRIHKDSLLAKPENNLTLSLTAFPNPFTYQTKIEISLPYPSKLTLEIYDIHGKVVNILTKSTFQEKKTNIIWNGRDFTGMPAPAGLYFAKITINDKLHKTFKLIKRVN
ncbi:MAG: T9SS type A sorting domain-containing protein [Bacteroidota bacterium]|nr:T9SS type A sorting domain-containing protein [Bacteroidota bacterium]